MIEFVRDRQTLRRQYNAEQEQQLECPVFICAITHATSLIQWFGLEKHPTGGAMCVWMANKVEALEVDVFVGYAATEIHYTEGCKRGHPSLPQYKALLFVHIFHIPANIPHIECTT
jgi:hypothetical protein